jgi:hypothetical protein
MNLSLYQNFPSSMEIGLSLVVPVLIPFKINIFLPTFNYFRFGSQQILKNGP